eukprot:6185655-Pleurochrysis_carterae.AAC.7
MATRTQACDQARRRRGRSVARTRDPQAAHRGRLQNSRAPWSVGALAFSGVIMRVPCAAVHLVALCSQRNISKPFVILLLGAATAVTILFPAAFASCVPSRHGRLQNASRMPSSSKSSVDGHTRRQPA